MKSAKPTFALKDRHFDNQTFDHHKLQIKPGSESSQCKFSERVKCQIEVKQPNELGVGWLYSVPGGEQEKKDGPCQSWIFLRVPEGISWDSHATKQWVTQYLNDHDWVSISSQDNKRFICPQCVKGDA